MRAALALLSCVGGARPPDARALPWFPVVGAGLGAALGLWWWAAGQLWPPLVAAALVVAADAVVTGMLHLDGLADSADGLLAHGLDGDRRLAIMAEPTNGAFALVVVALVVILRVGSLAALAPAPALLVALWAGSRGAMAVALLAVPGARPGGMAAAYARGHRPSPWWLGLVSIAVVGVAAGVSTGTSTGPAAVALATMAGLAAAGAVVSLARRRIGGVTGDVLGAAGVVAETVGLLVAAGRW